MSQVETIQTPQDYVNYTFNIEARGVAEVSSELMGLSNTVGNILGQLAFKTSEFLTHTESMAIGAGLAISGMFVSATKDAINFQQQIANVQAIGGETINAQAIGNAAMEYSNKFGMATASMTEGLEALARAGITSTDVMKEVLAEGVKLSKLEGMDLEDSINDLISTTNLLSEAGVDMNDANYGKLVQEMNQHIVSTSESAPINAQNIIQSLQHVGGYASASGMDQDDLFAVIAQLGARGTKGEMAGTALRAFIAAGQKDTAQRALARVGLDVSDLWNDNGETMLSISEMKNVLDEALEARGYSKQEKLEFYSDFVGYKQANQIMKIDTAEVEKYKESIATAWDLGKKLDTILGTVRGNLDRIWQITQNFMTRVGGQLLTIAGIILEPVRALLEFVTALPGADTAVAVGMIFVAFRTGLLVFNKLVPAVAGFMSGISDARRETKGFRGEWQKTRDELQKTKEIIDLIRHGDQAGLAKKHYEEHGLSARNKMDAERIVAGQMYMGSDWYQQHGRIPWEHIDTAAQDMILERFKGTEEFKQNYNAYVSRTRANVDEIVSNPIIIEEFESQGTLESINVWVQEIFDLLNSDRTRGQTDHAQEEGSQDNRRRNAQARTLSDIFNNRVRGNTYGNVDFKYEQNEQGYREAKEGLKQAYKDLREYTRALSNTDTNNINNIQKNAYKKLFTQVSDRGIEATKTANESEIRLVLEKGKLETHEHSYEGIKDSQVQYIASKLGLDDFKFYDSTQGDRRAEFAQQAYDALKDKDENIRKDIINELVNGADGQGGTNKLWEDSLSQIARGRRELLIHNPQIANKIVEQISNISTQGYDNNTDAVLGYFSNLDDNHDDWNIAIKSAMEVLKGDSDYSTIEENTIKYIADNIARHKETILNFQNNAESLGLSDAIQDELMDIVADMQNDAEILQNGGAELGAAIVEGFVGDGLGRHSPGKMFWALVDEQTDISNAILQSRGIFNKNAALLGLEMTNAFDSNLGLNRVFDSGIEYLRRDTDVIKDIIADFNREDFRTDDEIDLPYDLLPSQQDVQDGTLNLSHKKALEHFVRPYGFDMSNYERFGTKFGTDWTYDTRFQSMMWFMQHDFDYEKMFESGQFNEDDIYDHMDLFNKFFAVENTWLQSKTFPGDMNEETFNEMNKFLENYYFGFLATLSQNMYDIITQSNGLVDNIKLYRGGRLPLTGENLGEYLGTTSTSYAARIGDYYAWSNGAVNYKTNVFAPEGTLGIYPNEQLLRQRLFPDGVLSHNVYKNQLEYTLGNGQPYINLPNENGNYSTALRDEPDILLLTPDQIEEVQGVVVDEVASMINSGRTDSNILNLSGKQIATTLMNEKYDAGEKFNAQDIPKSDSLWGAGMHDTERGMIYDAATYIKKTQNKRVIEPEEIFSLIESVNGAEAAENAKQFLERNRFRDKFMKDNGKVKLTPLIDAMAQGNTDLWEQHKTLKQLGISQIVTPRQVFELMKQRPEIADDLRKRLTPYVDTRMGEQPTQQAFEDKGYMDESFVPIPYEYSWLLGADTANKLVDHLGETDPFRYGHKPTVSLDNALKIWEQLGPEAMLNGDFNYAYDDDLMPTVDNSFERMMLGLAYGTLDDKSAPYGSRSHGGGIHLYGKNTDYSGPEQTLGTLIHEFTHMALQQDYRHDLDESDALYLPSFTDDEAVDYGYGKDYPWLADEFETNWVVSQVFQLAGLDQLSTVQERVKGFYELTDKNGHTQHLQWELYDEWIKTISENIDKFIDLGEAFDRKYSDLSAAEISQKWDDVRKLVNVNNTSPASMPGFGLNGYIDYVNQQQREEEERRKNFGMPGLVENPPANYQAINKRQEEIAALRKQMAEDEKRWAEEGVKYAAEKRKQLEELRKKQKAHYQLTREIQEQMATGQLEYLIHYQNRGGVPNAPESASKSVEDSSDDEEYRDRINKEMATKYAGLFPDMDNKFNQARYNVNKDGQGNQRIMSMIDWAEKIHDKVHDKAFSVASGVADKYDDATTQRYINGIGAAQAKIQSIAQPLANFNDGLSRAAEIFPILSPMVWGLDTALWGLNMITSILELAETLLSVSKFQDMLVSWGLFTAEEAETIAKGEATIVTWLLTGAIGALEAIMSGPLLIVIAAIIAAIAIVYISEKKHAEALKETNKALEESNKSMNAALANYKSMHQARLSATDAGRKHIAALKESIALKKLETARYERLNNIEKKNRLENDPAWGETNSTRTFIQNGGAQWVPGLGGIIAQFLAGEYEPTAEKHAENQYQLRTIVDLDQTSGAFTPTNILKNMWEGYDTSYASDVNYYFKQHSREFAQMDAFAPQLEELYKIETQAQRIYGKEGARDSDMFKRALQDVANETGLNGETLGHYLDYMQVEANVENARAMATSGFGEIQAQIQAEAMSKLYPDGNNMGDLDSLQDTMVKAMVEDEARKAKRELFESAVLEYMQALYSVTRLDFDNAGKHFDAANTYLGGMQQIDENKEKILQDSLDIAEEGLRKDYGTGAYSIYGDTPFGGAVESAKSIGLSVPASSSSQSHNSSITSSNTTKNINKAASDAQTAATTAKDIAEKTKTQTQQQQQESTESGGWGWGEIAKNAVSGALDFAKKYDPLVGAISAFFPDNSKNDVQPTVNKYEIHVEQININTEDDPEKIKSALMNLIIEMQEQITPRQVSRTIGETNTNTANNNITEGTDNTQQQTQNNPSTNGG